MLENPCLLSFFFIEGVKLVRVRTHTQTRAQTTHTNPAFLPVIGSAHKVSFSVSPQQLEKLEKPVSAKALVLDASLKMQTHIFPRQ